MGLFDMKEISYSSLVKKYDNFTSPAMMIKVNGKKVSGTSRIYISEIDVALYMDKVCSANITLEMVYDLENRSFHSEVKNNFQLGSTISIELGYGSATEMVFYGYIHELQYLFSEAPSIRVVALDMRRLMMMNKENRTFTDKSYSDIFGEIIKKYSNVYVSKTIEATTDKIERVTQDVSDYDFVMKQLCQKANKDFYVLAGKVFFQAKNAAATPVLSLAWGENLFQFQISRRYCSEEIVVYGVNEKKLVVSKEKVETEGDYKKVTSVPITKEMISSDAKDAKSAKAIAKKEAEKRKKVSTSGTGSCIGIPELVPGHYLSIEKVDVGGKSDLSGYLVSVNHSFGDSGFTTSFELGG